MSQRGAVALWLSPSGDVCMLCRTTCKPGLGILFLCQLITGDSPTRPQVQAERGETALREWGPGACGTLPHVTYLCLRASHACLHHFHLVMDGATHAQLHGSVSLVNPGHYMAAWWTMVKLQPLLRPSNRPRISSQKESSWPVDNGRAFVPSPQGPYCYSPNGDLPKVPNGIPVCR